MAKQYDLILFGVTGFTGKLAAEYLLTHHPQTVWAACARSETKAMTILQALAQTASVPTPPVLVADLIGNDEQATDTLRAIVQSTRVVLTTAGPFEKYGVTLHRLCAQQGTHYADITGESAFVRHVIQQHDALARQSGACLVSHCGNDCIPQDLTVYEMHKYAQAKQCQLQSVVTYNEVHNNASFSGGTITTAMYQLSKPKTKSDAADPLLQTTEGPTSTFGTTVTHKTHDYVDEFQRSAGPYIMSPVMANCVRRSNALLGYNVNLKYGDVLLEEASWIHSWQRTAYKTLIGVALYIPFLRPYLLPQPGQGPDRETMEAGFLRLHGRGVMVDSSSSGQETQLASLMYFPKDTAYLMTAHMLVESGLLLASMDSSLPSGVVTPAVAFGSALTERLMKQLQVTWELKEVK